MCVLWEEGVRAEYAEKGVNGLCILGETSVFAEDQFESWGEECHFVCWGPGLGLGVGAGRPDLGQRWPGVRASEDWLS